MRPKRRSIPLIIFAVVGAVLLAIVALVFWRYHHRRSDEHGHPLQSQDNAEGIANGSYIYMLRTVSRSFRCSVQVRS